MTAGPMCCQQESEARQSIGSRFAEAPGAAGSTLTSRPQVTQKCQPGSTSLLHAGHCAIVTFIPQCGQKVTARPAGNAFVQ